MKRSDYFRFLAWCPHFVLTSAQHSYDTRTVVQVSRARWGPALDPIPIVPDAWPHAFDVSLGGQGLLVDSSG